MQTRFRIYLDADDVALLEWLSEAAGIARGRALTLLLAESETFLMLREKRFDLTDDEAAEILMGGLPLESITRDNS